jgi:hypothetical protein
MLVTLSGESASAKAVNAPVRPSARLERADSLRPTPFLDADRAAALAMAIPVDGRWSKLSTGITAKLPQRARIVTLRRFFDRECL